MSKQHAQYVLLFLVLAINLVLDINSNWSQILWSYTLLILAAHSYALLHLQQHVPCIVKSYAFTALTPVMFIRST